MGAASVFQWGLSGLGGYQLPMSSFEVRWAAADIERTPLQTTPIALAFNPDTATALTLQARIDEVNE